MGQAVPKDDLPGNLVPASDLPDSGPAPKENPVNVTEPGPVETALKVAPYAAQPMMLPGRLALEGVSRAGKMLERGAYKAGGAITDVFSRSQDEFGNKLPPEAAAALGLATNVALQTVPTVIGSAAGTATAPTMQRWAERLMRSSLKPDKFSRESGEAARAVETLLDKGYNVTHGGVEKMTAAIDKLDDALDKAIAGSKANVSTISAIKPIKDAIAKFKDGLDHAENEEAIRKEVLKFFDHPEVQGAFQIPVQLAQRIKRAIYTELGDKAYGLGIKPAAQREGKKAIARGLKEGIERAVPESGKINKEMGDLVNARDLVKQRVEVAQNRDPLGFGSFWFLNPKELAVWLANRNEFTKSALARALHSGRSTIPTAAGSAVGGAAGYEAGRPER